MSRTPAIERKIAEIEENDIFVSVLGMVVSKNTSDYTMTIDDGTGQIAVFGDKLFDIETVIRVIGKPFENGNGINADILQDFSTFNMPLYHKIKSWEARI
ncbi:MAG: OB-fold nucleic acid binding domain-containing protein [Candidatus Methanofastidiosia archaeon]